MNKSINKLSFTLIEIVMTIVVLGIIAVPVGIMSIEYMQSIAYSREIVIAEGLAKTEIAKINNLSYSDVTLADAYDNTNANYEGYTLDVRREVDYVAGSSNNLKNVIVTVYRGGTTTLLAKVVTYVASVSFGPGSGGGGVGGGGEADSLVVSGGSISAKNLQNITLENTSASDITITGTIISFSGSGGTKAKTITMDGSQRWSGTASSGSAITLDTNFALLAGTTYNNTGLFTFSKNLSSVSSLVFIMSDATETIAYSW